MYEEQETYRIGINWKDIIVKLIFLIVFFMILMWLMPNPNLDPFYNKIFNENIQTMKDAAKSYYTVNRLPETIGESTPMMTLKEMEDSNLIIPFVDKNNEVCNQEKSFVQVTKTGEDEYVLKVQLSCGDETDFILETIGCYDVCIHEDCKAEEPEVEEEPTKPTTPTTPTKPTTPTTPTKPTSTIEYQFKQPIVTSNTEYLCPAGYTKVDKECTKMVESEKINATAKYSETKTEIINATPNGGDSKIVYADPIKEKVGTEYTCPSGYVKNGTKCYIYTSGTVIEGTTEYSCPSGYTEHGSTCYKTTNATTNSTSTCPSGYSENSSGQCYKTTNATTNSTSSCPSGYSENSNGQCYKTTSATTTAGSKSCPSGYSANGSNCKKSYSATATTGGWVWKSSNTYTSQLSEYENSTEKRVLTNSAYKKTCSSCYTYAWYYTYTTYTRSTSYTCPNGGSLSGSTCVSYASYNTTAGTTTCSSGTLQNGQCYHYTNKVTTTGAPTCSSGTLQNGKCYHYTSKVTTTGTPTCPSGYNYNSSEKKCYAYTDQIKHETADKTVCPSGYTLDSTGKCYKSTSASSESKYTYSCPTGYTELSSGENLKCYKTVGTEVTYSCPSGYKLDGTKCSKELAPTLLGYTCPSGYNLKDVKFCTKTEKESIAAETKITTSTSYKYMWSTKTSITGWERTGETRKVN